MVLVSAHKLESVHGRIRILFQILQQVLDFGKMATALSLWIIIYKQTVFGAARRYTVCMCDIYIYIYIYINVPICCVTVRQEKRNYINGNPRVYLLWGLFSVGR